MYISIRDKGFRIIKKKIGKSESGRTIYRDVVEVTCPECDPEGKYPFEQEIVHEADGNLKISCPKCKI